MNVINFFREDLSEILGIYCNDDKIFMARLTETAEIDFETDLNHKTSAVEQIAEKIKSECDKRDWKISKVGLILREGTATTYQTDFKNIPANEIENAVKIWAKAHVGKDARYTSIKLGEEIWMEALNADIVEEYVSAFEKNSMQLCAITELPHEQFATPLARAIFAADIIQNKKSPNILPQNFSTWNIKKISLTVAAIFFIVLLIFSAQITHEYFYAVTRAETAQKRLNFQSDTFSLKMDLDAVTAKIKRFNAVISNRNINFKNFNALIKTGKIADGKIFLDKIKATDETFELEGVAESSDAVKLYLNRLKNLISPQIKLKNSIEDDGQIFFTISVIFRPHSSYL